MYVEDGKRVSEMCTTATEMIEIKCLCFKVAATPLALPITLELENNCILIRLLLVQH